MYLLQFTYIYLINVCWFLLDDDALYWKSFFFFLFSSYFEWLHFCGIYLLLLLMCWIFVFWRMPIHVNVWKIRLLLSWTYTCLYCVIFNCSGDPRNSKFYDFQTNNSVDQTETTMPDANIVELLNAVKIAPLKSNATRFSEQKTTISPHNWQTAKQAIKKIFEINFIRKMYKS